MKARHLRDLTAIVLAVVTVLATSPLGATERRPLPKFSLTDVHGAAIASETLSLTGKWLLIYVQPRCEACDTLLRAIDIKDQPGLPARVAIVVGRTDAAGAAAEAARFPDLGNARWYADRERSSQNALRVSGVPVVYGLRNEVIEWSLAGVFPDVAGVKSALIGWAGVR